MTIFVHDDSLYGQWKWYPRFTYLLSERYGLEWRLVNFLETPLPELAAHVGPNDGLLGRWGHHPSDLAAIQPIADRLATLFGGRVFPAPHTYLYYDDKARQASLFLNRGYPTPATAVVASAAELEAFVVRESLSFPLVMKLSHGAGSSGVKLLRSPAEATFPCIVQQFCPSNDRDYRINVIGHRVMGFARLNRENDFRASGSGSLVYEESFDPALVELAMRISRENGFDSMAYDFVRLDGRWVVLEMSYCYVDTAVRDCAFYYDTLTGERVAKPGVYPQDFIVEDFFARHYAGVSEGAAASDRGRRAADASEPRDTGAPRRPRILLIADVPDWIFARHCRVLVDRLSDEFEFTVKCRNEPFEEDEFDLIYPLEWNLVTPEQIRRPGKYVTGIRSHTSWNGHDFEQFVTFLRDGFQRVHAVSRRLHRLLEPFVPGLVSLSHGVDTRFFAPDAMTGLAVPRTGNVLRVGWAGNRKAPGKGVEIIEPLGQVPQIELVTCGYGHNHLAQDEMRKFYAGIDVYACASIQEGNNNSLMEAAAMEVAIVTVDNGAVPEYLEDGASALVVEREYPAFLAACQELAADPQRRRALGKAARQAVIEHFDWGLIVEGYREFFRSAMQGASVARPDTVALSHPDRIRATIPAAASAAAAAQMKQTKDELRRATHLNDAVRLILPAIVSRGIEEIAVYGAGEAGQALAEALGWHRVRVTAFIDRDPAKTGTDIGGVSVFSIEEAVRRGVTTFAIGSFAFAREIRQTIEAAYAMESRRPVIFDAESPSRGRVSVIVCTHGERVESFEWLVSALERQATDFELVVVLGQASERLRRAVAALGDRARVVECPEPNISRARNTGIRAAGGDIVVFIDDDAVPADREWLARLTAPLMDSGRIAAAGGAVMSGYSDRLEFGGGATSSAGFQLSGPQGEGDVPPPDGSEWLPRVPGGNCAYLAAALRDIGGFDEQYAYYLDEVDVCVRLIAKGYGVVPVDNAAILHYPAPSAHGPAQLRDRRLIARSDGYFVMRHASGSKARRAWLAMKYLPAKPYFVHGASRRRAGLFTAADFVKFQAQCAVGLAAGIWAGRAGGAKTATASTADAAPGDPVVSWRPFPRRTPSRAAVAVHACSRFLADWNDAMSVATALSRNGYDVSLAAGLDVTALAPRPVSPGFEAAADVWEAACAAVRLSRFARDWRRPAAAAEVAIGSELVARLRAALGSRVIHVATGHSAAPASSPVGRWLGLGKMSRLEPVGAAVTEVVSALERLLADDADSLSDASPGAPDEMGLIARAWLARLRDDLAREPALTPWPFRTRDTWAIAMILVRHTVNNESEVALDLATAYGAQVRAIDPALAAEFDYHAARALRVLKRDAAAWPLYERIAETALTGAVSPPIHAGACYHLAVAAVADRRVSMASELLTECLRLQPEHGAARRLLEQLQSGNANAA